MIQDRLLIEDDTAERFVAIFHRANGLIIFLVAFLGIAGSFFLYIGYLTLVMLLRY